MSPRSRSATVLTITPLSSQNSPQFYLDPHGHLIAPPLSKHTVLSLMHSVSHNCHLKLQMFPGFRPNSNTITTSAAHSCCASTVHGEQLQRLLELIERTYCGCVIFISGSILGLMISSMPRAIVLQTHNPVAQLKRTESLGRCLLSRQQPVRSFWGLPFCPILRCGDSSRKRSSTTMEGSNNASSNTTRAGPSTGRADQRFARQYNFETIILEPKGEHLATVVWLHGFSDSGARWAAELKNVDQLSPNIRWIIPTAPLARDIPVTAWFEFRYGQDVDMEGLDRSAETVAKLLLNEKTRAGGSQNVKLAVGGFSQGCATALYITACSVLGKYGGNGKPFPVKLDAAIGLSGWMPTIQSLVSQMSGNRDASERARKTSLFIGHCDDDGVVPARLAKASYDAFRGVGFNDITLKTYPTGKHSATKEEIGDMREWITTKLGLEKSRTPTH